MRRLLLLLTALAALAGCDAGGGPAPLPEPYATASFPPGAVVNVIHVDVLDRLALRGAALVAPDGTETAASWLEVSDKVGASGGQFAMSSPWRGASAFSGANPTLPPTANAEATFYSQKELLLMPADADIPLPDPVLYRRDWQNYKIRLSFGAPDALVTRDIPAPQPPPG